MERSIQILKLKSKLLIPIKLEYYISFIAGAGFFLKQFYLSKSGTLQIGDMFMLASAALCIMNYGLKLHKPDLYFICFILCTYFVNLCNSLVYHVLIIRPIYYLTFNAILVVLLYRTMIEKECFLHALETAFKLALICQLLILLSGKGRWYGTIRYMGTFNDPNQYGFYIFSSLLTIYIISIIRNKHFSIAWIIISGFEISYSASSGMLISFLAFFAVYYFTYLGGVSNKGLKIAIFVFLIAVLPFFVIIAKTVMTGNSITSLPIIYRFTNRISSGNGFFGTIKLFIYGRGLQKIFFKPIYFLFGCGEGAWERFIPITGETNEIHCSVIALLYCYGVIPYCLLIKWVSYNIKNINRVVMFAYFPLLLETFTLVNHRQPIFWLLIVLASHPNCKTKNQINKLSVESGY